METLHRESKTERNVSEGEVGFILRNSNCLTSRHVAPPAPMHVKGVINEEAQFESPDIALGRPDS